MYMESVENVAAIAERKAKFVKAPVPYLISSALAGAYVGLGIALIASIGAPLAFGSSPLIKLVMGLSFGIALTGAFPFSGSCEYR